MIMSPVEIKTDDGKAIKGILVEKDYAIKIISLIDRTNSDGLKGEDALIQMQLKQAVRAINDSEGNEKKEEECKK